MKTRYISPLAMLVLSVLCIPQMSHAYFTTNQSAVRINEHTALYAIEYAFGLIKQDIYMPVVSTRTANETPVPKTAGYSIVEDDAGVIHNGTTYGMVVSSAPIVDSMYKIEKGKAQKMTLYIIYTTSSTTPEMDYKLQMDSLPFYVDVEGTGDITKLQTRQLNPSELQYYVTRNVELNSKAATVEVPI